LLLTDNMYERIYTYICPAIAPCKPPPWPCLCFIPLPLHVTTLPFYLLGDPFSCARGANIHPPSSLVSYQLFSSCWLTHPEDTPQIKLHIYIDDINNISRSVWYTKNKTKCIRWTWKTHKCFKRSIFLCRLIWRLKLRISVEYREWASAYS
jgi:hypothetical protein